MIKTRQTEISLLPKKEINEEKKQLVEPPLSKKTIPEKYANSVVYLSNSDDSEDELYKLTFPKGDINESNNVKKRKIVNKEEVKQNNSTNNSKSGSSFSRSINSHSSRIVKKESNNNNNNNNDEYKRLRENRIKINKVKEFIDEAINYETINGFYNILDSIIKDNLNLTKALNFLANPSNDLDVMLKLKNFSCAARNYEMLLAYTVKNVLNINNESTYVTKELSIIFGCNYKYFL
ncbi:hypothetical protein ABK040_013689 [Willaertia magna]